MDKQTIEELKEIKRQMEEINRKQKAIIERVKKAKQNSRPIKTGLN